jgi:hypothetical protein
MQSVSRVPKIFDMSLHGFCRDTSSDFALASNCVCSFGEASQLSRSDLYAFMHGRLRAAPGVLGKLI